MLARNSLWPTYFWAYLGLHNHSCCEVRPVMYIDYPTNRWGFTRVISWKSSGRDTQFYCRTSQRLGHNYSGPAVEKQFSDQRVTDRRSERRTRWARYRRWKQYDEELNPEYLMRDVTPAHVNQKGAIAGADLVAGDKIVHNHASPEKKLSIVEQLLQKLQKEIDDNRQVRDTIEALRHYHTRKSHDGIDGLEAKLKHSGREHETFRALEKKELFAKMLEKWSLYSSAQEIFVHLLARAEHEFSMYVLPQLSSLKEHEINHVIDEKIVDPIVTECGTTVFQMNHGIAMGMLYWLAEQCFVRWHK